MASLAPSLQAVLVPYLADAVPRGKARGRRRLRVLPSVQQHEQASAHSFDPLLRLHMPPPLTVQSCFFRVSIPPAVVGVRLPDCVCSSSSSSSFCDSNLPRRDDAGTRNGAVKGIGTETMFGGLGDGIAIEMETSSLGSSRYASRCGIAGGAMCYVGRTRLANSSWRGRLRWRVFLRNQKKKLGLWRISAGSEGEEVGGHWPRYPRSSKAKGRKGFPLRAVDVDTPWVYPTSLGPDDNREASSPSSSLSVVGLPLDRCCISGKEDGRRIDGMMEEQSDDLLGWGEEGGIGRLGEVGGGGLGKADMEEEEEEEEEEEKRRNGNVGIRGATILSTSFVVGLIASGRAEAGDWPPRGKSADRRHLRRREEATIGGEREGGAGVGFLRRNMKQTAGDRSRWRNGAGGGGVAGNGAKDQSPILIVDKDRMTFTINLAAGKQRIAATWQWVRDSMVGRMADLGDLMRGSATVDLSGAARSATNRAKEAKRATVSTVRKYQRKLDRLSQPLRSSVVVGPDGRMRATTRGEQARAWGVLLLGTVMTIVVGRWFILMAQRNRWGWEEWYSGEDDGRGGAQKVVRDRSLGGREVFVGDGDNLWQALRARWNGRGRSGEQAGAAPERRRRRSAGSGVLQRSIGPLDEADDRASARSERVLFARGRSTGGQQVSSAGARMRERGKSRMPQWWPLLPDTAPRLSPEKQENWRAEAQGVLKTMLDARLAGQDFRDSDILELRRLCRTYGVSVTIETTNTKESLFRSAVSFALSACTSPHDNLLMAPDRPSSFVAGMAYHLGVEIERAVIMVNAAVAARTRAGFMQAWAFQKQGRKEDAEKEAQALAQIHKEFTPEQNSPELELVARGLESRIAISERKGLFDIYVSVGGRATAAVAEEALALGINDPSRALE